MAKIVPRSRGVRIREKSLHKHNERYEQAIFDPSLLVPPSNILLRAIAESRDTMILLTKHMFEVVLGNRKETLRLLLRLWDAAEEEIDSIIRYKEREYENVSEIFQLKEKEILEIIALNKITEKIKTHKIIPVLRDSGISNESLLNFIGDEICLELQCVGKPIFCTETTTLKILEIIKRIGAKSRGESIGKVDRKYSFLEENWKSVLADSMGFASVYLFVSPLDSIIHHGFKFVRYAVAYP